MAKVLLDGGVQSSRRIMAGSNRSGSLISFLALLELGSTTGGGLLAGRGDDIVPMSSGLVSWASGLSP